MDHVPIPSEQVIPLDVIAPGVQGLRIAFVNVFAIAHGDGAWTLNLMVFLGGGAGTEKINIVYYDMSKKPPDQVSFTEVAVKADQKIVQLNGQGISKEMGFVKGHKYEIRATRLVGGKEKVYAKTTITLK